MFEMKHLVIDEIFNGISRHILPIEYPADHDRIVRWIIVSKVLPRRVAAPGHQRAGEQSVKEAAIEVLENRLQVVGPALGRKQHLSSAFLSHQVCLAGDIASSQISAIAGRMPRFDVLAVQLGQQDMCNGVQHVLRRTRQKVGDTHENFSIPQTDGVIDVRKREELNVKLGEGSPRTHLAIRLEKNFLELGGHLS